MKIVFKSSDSVLKLKEAAATTRIISNHVPSTRFINEFVYKQKLIAKTRDIFF